MIQDIAPIQFHNEWLPNAVPAADSVVMHFVGRNLLCRIAENGLEFPRRAQFSDAADAFTYLFSLDDTAYFLLRGEGEAAVDGFAYQDINLFRTARPKVMAYAAVNAWHLTCWYRDTRFCGRCGAELEPDVNERMMRCPKCGNMLFPRLNPSVIVAVTNGDKLLVTQYANRPLSTRMVLIAGFTEFGETVEDTVRREVMEEVGLKVKNVRYYKSQPWGISGGLLLGYWCEVDGDDTVHLDGNELAAGTWLTRQELREAYLGNDFALTSEMISRFAAGKEFDPVNY